MASPSWTASDSARLTELHGAGRSLSSIAKTMGRSKETIARRAERLCLSFDRSRTAKAAEAVHVDNKARRVVLESRLLVDAEKLLDQLWRPSLVYSFGGSKNTYAEHTLERPDPLGQRNIMQSTALALTAANKLFELNAGSSSESAVDAWLQMITGLELFAAEYEREQRDGVTTPQPPGAPPAKTPGPSHIQSAGSEASTP